METTDNYDQTHQPRGTKRKGSWMREEDDLLRKCIEKYGEGNWNHVPVRAGLNRCRKSCRLRWLNYLKPNVKQGEFAMDEVDLIIRMHKLLGNKWSLIAGRLPGRTGNGVKNYWNTHLKPSKQRPESNVTMKQSKQHPESNVMHLKQSKQRCPESNVTRKQSKQRPESNVMHLKQSKQRCPESNVMHLKQSKQRCPESNVTIGINKADDKQIIRNDHQDKVLVIRPKPQSFSENSKWIKGRSILMRGSTDIEQPASSSPRMVTKSTDSHEPLPEFLTDEALTSWWQENINVLLDHDDHQMKKRKRGVLLTEKVINSACCCRCGCNQSTTDDQSATPTDKEQQDLCVDDYLLNELQNIPW